MGIEIKIYFDYGIAKLTIIDSILAKILYITKQLYIMHNYMIQRLMLSYI